MASFSHLVAMQLCCLTFNICVGRARGYYILKQFRKQGKMHFVSKRIEFSSVYFLGLAKRLLRSTVQKRGYIFGKIATEHLVDRTI